MTLEEFLIDFGENNECSNCPIYINDVDYRTKTELDTTPCCENLMKWIKQELNK